MAWCLPLGTYPPARTVSLLAASGPFVSFSASSTQLILPIPFPNPVTVSCSWAACTGSSPAQGSLYSVPRKPPPLSWGPLTEVFRGDKAFRGSTLLPSPSCLPASSPLHTATQASAWLRLSPAPGSSSSGLCPRELGGQRGGRKGRKRGLALALQGMETQMQPGLWEGFTGAGGAGSGRLCLGN